jgi:sigma-70-like protein
VQRFNGCLGQLPRSERRVLDLRAGVGRLRPHSRSEVARITHLRRARVVTLERRGLRRLRALNRAGACVDAAATTTVPIIAAPGTGTPLPPPTPRPDRSGVLAEHHASGNSGGKDGGAARKPEQAELSISRPASGGGGSFDLALVLAPLAVLAFLLVITREVRRAS